MCVHTRSSGINLIYNHSRERYTNPPANRPCAQSTGQTRREIARRSSANVRESVPFLPQPVASGGRQRVQWRTPVFIVCLCACPAQCANWNKWNINRCKYLPQCVIVSSENRRTSWSNYISNKKAQVNIVSFRSWGVSAEAEQFGSSVSAQNILEHRRQLTRIRQSFHDRGNYNGAIWS